MKAKSLTITYDSQGKVILTISLAERIKTDKLNKLADSGKMLNVEVKQFREKRSVTANGYMWKLCNELAKPLRSTKEEVYHESVRKVGLYEDREVDVDTIKLLAEVWSSKGEGWQIELSTEPIKDGKKWIRLYRGSSVYNTKQFSRLLEYIIDECKEQDIEVRPQEEIDRLIAMVESR